MNTDFQIAGGSTIGKVHTRIRQNNQDAFYFQAERGSIVAVVCDGCGEKTSEHNDFGAKLGVRLTTASISNQLGLLLARNSPETLLGASQTQWEAFFEKIRQDILAKMRVIALEMGGTFTETILNYFLFTIVGVLAMPTVTISFSVGDGLTIVNDEQKVLGPFPNNQPPYLGYGLLDPAQITIDPHLLRFKLHKILPTSELFSFLIGTDGIVSLMNASATRIPGREETVGPIGQFWQEDIYFANPFAISRRLAVINGEKKSIDWENRAVDVMPGLLEDDTTLVVCRRKQI